MGENIKRITPTHWDEKQMGFVRGGGKWQNNSGQWGTRVPTYATDANLSDNISNKLINVAGVNFRQVVIDEALRKISRFGLAIDQCHFSPNLIKKDFSDKLTIKEYGDRKYISMMEDSRREGSNLDQDSMNIGAKIGYGLFSIRASYCIVKKNGDKWKNGDYSFNEQLNDLNWARLDSVKCGIEGTLVILKMFQFLGLVNDMVVSHKKRQNSRQAALNNLAADSAQAAVDDAARRQRIEQARNERRQAQPTRQELLKERHESWNTQAKREHAEFLRASGKQRVVQPVAAAQSQ
uniref:Uncharacterized protein n=1 Tax=Romanomermis culicivorax TaxID=13658 RepID=A0A915INC5_ROMCU